MKFSDDELCDMQIDFVKLYDKKTGEEVMDLTGSDCSIDCSLDTYIPNVKYPINYYGDITLEINNVQINDMNLLSEFGVDKSKLPDAYNVEYVQFVQARKHKKRRINKKWLKKYGCKQVLCKLKGWKLQSFNDDGTFMFVKDSTD